MLTRLILRWLGLADLRDGLFAECIVVQSLADQVKRLEKELADLRTIVTTRPKPERPQQARTWSQAKRLMGDLEERGVYAD